MQNTTSRLKLQKVSPFIGHAGIGARMEVKDQGQSLILRETTFSQLSLILFLAICCIYPGWLLIFKTEQINGGYFGKSILLIMAMLTFPFLCKYIFRFALNRRIEIDHINQQIIFITEFHKLESSIQFADVQKVEITKSEFRSEGLFTKNYTLNLIDKNNKSFDLCTSDKEDNIFKVYEKVARFFPN